MPSHPETEKPGLDCFHPTLRDWFADALGQPTQAQSLAWPPIAAGQSTLLLAPTGSGKTLAAFLVAIDRIMFADRSVATKDKVVEDRAAKDKPPGSGCQVLYISPLKALGVDVERNLQVPIAGVRSLAERNQVPHCVPTVGIRSGDTPAHVRQRLRRHPPDILITTPESIYLMLTSRAREALFRVSTVIIDEIHTLLGNKRGAHLFLSLERLEKLRRRQDPSCRPMQRIGLSATQKPLDEIARLLGGADVSDEPEAVPVPRPVELVQAGRSKPLDLRIEVPVEDMARLSEAADDRPPTPDSEAQRSIWPSIHPRLVELIQSHTTTMIFVNNRRLAERLAAAINEQADTELALAHHGSLARDQRQQIESRLKQGQLPAIVATSSLELGIDMGAVDLVIQIEAPPSIASGIQRVGRAGHQVGAVSKGVIFPKYRGDLLACSAAVPRMLAGDVEATFYPRNPLDVLAQQVAAMVALEPVPIDELFATVRSSAPFFELPRSSFEGTLDLLAGRYPSDDFAELRPRINWDRLAGIVSPRNSTQRTAILNAGTIPDRGLYGVFLAGDDGSTSRVGELDEEMVFETKPGEVFLLGASAWRVMEITHDRVLVTPAPGEPGIMPFWRGDGPGRPLEFGRAIGALTGQLASLPREQAERLLVTQHALEERAARNLVDYLADQAEATGDLPTDRTILIECFPDEAGDWRVVILSPLGARVHAPWATAVSGRLEQTNPGEVDTQWTDDGIVFRLPGSRPPPVELLVPRADEVEDQVLRQLPATSLFAARFRENAARALLLPRRQANRRMPLWLQRRRAADLLAVAARYRDFPILLETYRECLQNVFDIDGLKGILQEIEQKRVRVKLVETRHASPFASAMLFGYVGNYIYNGDAPLAERRAATLSLDHAQLRQLLGDAGLRELLSADVIDALALQLQRLDARYQIRHADSLHDTLLRLGDLSRRELAARCPEHLDTWLDELLEARRIVAIQLGNELRFIAAEDVSRYRDALGIVAPPGLPAAMLESVDDPLGDLVSRFARTHVPFLEAEVAERWTLGVAPIRAALASLAARDRVLEGEFTPGRTEREWSDSDVLRRLKHRSLARLREQVKPVAPAAFAQFMIRWHGIDSPRRGLDGVLDAVEQLQNLPLPASSLERDILPRRVAGFRTSDLDELCMAGEIVWRGCDRLGADDGRIALYLTEAFPALAPSPQIGQHQLAIAIRELLKTRGALFFDEITRELGLFQNDLLETLWEMVWAGEVSNDTLAPLRSLRRRAATKTRSRRRHGGPRSRRASRLAGSEGRWSLLVRDTPVSPSGATESVAVSATERQAAWVQQLLLRHGIVTRDCLGPEPVQGGFSAIYPVLKAMEEAGRIRRGYFVQGLGAAQFAAPGADDQLRDRIDAAAANSDAVIVLAATDPANPYGSALPWPSPGSDSVRPMRVAGARVILWRGRLIGYVGRKQEDLITFPATGDDSSQPAEAALEQALVQALVGLASPTQAVFLSRIDNQPATDSRLCRQLEQAGFVSSSRGMLLRRRDEPMHDPDA